MLHEALRLLRVYHDMKQNELAAKIGVSISYVSEIEKGNRTPSLEVIGKYSTVFKVPISSILFFAEQIGSDPKNKKDLSATKTMIASKIIKFLQIIESRTEADHA